jgi:opacity protein-like surface antigen
VFGIAITRDLGDARMRWVIGAAVIAAMLGVLGPLEASGQETSNQGSQAQAAQPPPAPGSPWSFRVSPYLWFSSISGDVGVNPNLPVLDVDVDFSEIFKSIDWFPPPAMFVGEVRYGRFAAFTDFIFLGLEADDAVARGPVVVAADLELDTVIWTFGGSFRAVEDGRVTLDLLAGGRLWNVDAKGTLAGPLAVRQRSGSQTWVDPIIGIAGRVELGSGFALLAEGDVGGFGIASDLDWQVLGTLQYAINDSITLDAGYRYLSVDFDDGGFLFDVALSGPIIGASFRF